MREFAALLNSRQPLRPTGRDGWVKKTVEAVDWLKKTDRGVISSISNQTWELATALASAKRLPLKLVLPAKDNAEFDQLVDWATGEFDLDISMTEFIPCVSSGNDKETKNHLRERDRLVVKLADLLLPVSIRAGGIMSGFVEGEELPDKPVDHRFRISPEPRTEPLAYSLRGLKLNQALDETANSCLIHWTRTINSAWPEERLIDFYLEVVDSERYVRTAFECLRRIINTGRIISSSHHMPAGVRTVSFSSALPSEIVPLIRWRARHNEMSFEPYGVGLTEKLAREIGLKPVVYYDRDEDPVGSLSANGQGPGAWLTQSQGGLTDWRKEKEYRCLGDLNLHDLPRKELKLFCLWPDQARQLTTEFGIKAVSFSP